MFNGLVVDDKERRRIGLVFRLVVVLHNDDVSRRGGRGGLPPFPGVPTTDRTGMIDAQGLSFTLALGLGRGGLVLGTNDENVTGLNDLDGSAK